MEHVRRKGSQFNGLASCNGDGKATQVHVGACVYGTHCNCDWCKDP